MTILGAALKDLRRSRRDPIGLLLCLAIPAVMGGLMSIVFGGSGGDAPVPRPHVLVADADTSFLAGLVRGALAQSAVADVADVEFVRDADEGRRRLEAGEASALLVLPEGFEQAVLDETPLALPLVTNPAQRILPGMVEETLTMAVDLVFYVQRLLGAPLRALMQSNGADASVAMTSVLFKNFGERLAHYLDPPLLQLDVTLVTPEQTGPRPTFGQILFPGILWMALLFVAQALASEIWIERELGTLARIAGTPLGTTGFLLGKALSSLLLLGGVCAVGLLVGWLAYDLVPARLPLAFAWSVLTGLVFAGLFLFLTTLASSPRAANILTTLVVFPLLMLGGSFIPFEGMPDAMAALGRFTPNGWALVHLRGVLGGSSDLLDLALPTLVLLAVAAALFGLAASRLRRQLASAGA